MWCSTKPSCGETTTQLIMDDAMYAAPCTGGVHVNRTLLHCSAHLLGACTSAHNVESARRGRQVGAATTTVPYNAKVAAKPPHNRSIMDSGTMTPSTVLPAPVKSMLLRVTTDPPWTPVP